MLKFLRTHRTGFFGAVVMGLVCFTMIGFGINFFAPQGSAGTVIRINDREVSFAEFQNKLNSFRALMQQRLGENFEQFASIINFEQETVDSLIDEALFSSFVAKLDVTPSTSLVHQQIASLPFFNGVVTESSYRAYLRAAGMSGPQLEAAMRQDIASSLFRSTFIDLNAPTEAELLASFRRTNRQMSFHLATFAPASFTDKVEVSDENKLIEFFEEQIETYRQPAKVQYQAAIFRSENYAKEVTVTDEDIEESYEQVQNTFVIPAQVSFRRIFLKKSSEDDSNPLDALVGADETDSAAMSTIPFSEQQRAKIEAARQRIDAGESFETLVQEISEDEVSKAAGGLVEPTEYALLNEPIRSALFELEPLELSAILQDAQGYYLLMVEEKQEEQVRPLEEVRQQVRRLIQSEYAPEYARIAAEEFAGQLEGDIDEKQFAAAAAEKSIPTAATVQPVQRGQSSGSIPVGVTDAALNLEVGDVELVEQDNDSYVVQVTERVESLLPEFSDVRERVKEDYVRVKSAELAKVAAKEFLAALKEADDPGSEILELAEPAAAKVETLPMAIVGAPAHPLFRQPSIAQSAYGLTAEAPLLEGVQDFGSEYLVVAFAEEKLPENEEFAAQRAELRTQELRTGGNRLFATLQKLLRAEAEVWVSPTILDSQEI